MAFLSELFTNASINNVSAVYYSGNDDSLLPHHGTQGELYHLEEGYLLIYFSLVIIQARVHDNSEVGFSLTCTPEYHIRWHSGFHAQTVHSLVR